MNRYNSPCFPQVLVLWPLAQTEWINIFLTMFPWRTAVNFCCQGNCDVSVNNVTAGDLPCTRMKKTEDQKCTMQYMTLKITISS